MSLILPFPQYFKRFGIFRPDLLLNPRITSSLKLQLPIGVVWHYLPRSETDVGPALTEPFIADAPRLVFIDHAQRLLTDLGGPRASYVQPGPIIRDYRKTHVQLRPMNNYELATREPKNLLIENYAILPKLYKYIRSYLSGYYRWYNLRATMWLTINATAPLDERQHFIELELPPTLPGLEAFRNLDRGMSKDHLAPFSLSSQLDLFDLWNWLGPNRGKSPLAGLDPRYYDRVNIILRRLGGWTVVNLGLLNKWRKVKLTDKGLDAASLQVHVLKMLQNIYERTNLVQSTDQTLPLEETENPDAEPEDSAIDEGLKLLEENPVDETELENPDPTLELPPEETPQDQAELTDEDGQVIAQATGEVSTDTGIAVPPMVPNVAKVEPPSLTSAIQAQVEDLSQKGLLTPGEARRMERLASSYTTLKNPYNPEETLEQALVVPEEALVLQGADTYPDQPEIIDKSMLQSTVQKLDSQYVTQVMSKDILNAVMSVQKAGVAVTGYRIEEVQDAVSHYEVHTITLTPVVGKPSTISFRVPKVDEQGVYVSNGSRYRLRQQKTDLPIRKVSPTRVALSSYYAKIFVERSQRSVYNYDGWLVKQLVAKGLDPNDPTITDIKITDVSDPSYKLPRAYSIISTRVMAFKHHGAYWFDYRNRLKSGLFTEKDIERIDQAYPDMALCGRVGDDFVLMDFQDALYQLDAHDGHLTPLGSVEEVFGLDQGKAPVPMAELSIFSKTIPLGMVLGYLLGFETLLERLGVQPRRVRNGERLNLGPDEYVLRFLDESLVFPKEDLRAALVVNGFNLYHRSIRNYSVSSFNSRDVYATVLETAGIGVRYLRELDLMTAMFVDPITADILRWMKEPTEFVPLLMRACEMLVTHYVPSKIETADGLVEGMERARTYERVAGTVYSEMVRALRVYNARSASSAAQITMNPLEVWTQIVQDPAAMLIDDINPIQNTKQKEVITYGGRGGRSRQSMTASSRLYKESDKGFISEGTVDSGDVGVITYVAPNANYTTVRGTVRMYDEEKDGASSLLSTAALISPAADRDDRMMYHH